MRYRNTVFLLCASLSLLGLVVSQEDAAGTGTAALAKSTKTETRAATATVGDADPAVATMATGVIDASGDVGLSTDESVDSAGADDYDAGSGTDGVDGTSDISAANMGDDSPAGSGADDMRGVGNNSPGAGGERGPGGADKDCDKPEAKGPGREKGQVRSKFAAGNGHPHQPVARRWFDWFGGGGGRGSGVQQGHVKAERHHGRDVREERGQSGDGRDNGQQQHNRHMARGGGMRGDWTGKEDHSAGRQGSHSFHARDNIVKSGPSWNHVRNGGVASVKVARDSPWGENGSGRGEGQSQHQGQGQGQGQGHGIQGFGGGMWAEHGKQ